MRKSFRSLTIVAVILLSSLVASATTTLASAPTKGTPIPPATPANISWE